MAVLIQTLLILGIFTLALAGFLTAAAVAITVVILVTQISAQFLAVVVLLATFRTEDLRMGIEEGFLVGGVAMLMAVMVGCVALGMLKLKYRLKENNDG